MTRALSVFIIVLFALPAALFAQQEETLRAQIRADLENDPRARSLSTSEFEALVSSMVDEANRTGATEAYLESQNTFDYGVLFSAQTDSSPLQIPAILMATLALFAILSAVLIHMVRNRGKASDEPADVAA